MYYKLMFYEYYTFKTQLTNRSRHELCTVLILTAVLTTRLYTWYMYKEQCLISIRPKHNYTNQVRTFIAILFNHLLYH